MANPSYFLGDSAPSNIQSNEIDLIASSPTTALCASGFGTPYGLGDSSDNTGTTAMPISGIIQDSGQAQAFTSTKTIYNAQVLAYDTSDQPSSTRATALPMVFQDEPKNDAAIALATLSSKYPAEYGQSSAGQPDIAGMAFMEGEPGKPSQAPSGVAVEQEAETTLTIEQAYMSCQSNLREIFKKICSGNLTSASDELLHILGWFLSHIAELGMLRDDTYLQEQRQTMWTAFNHAWLALLQRQKDLMESGWRPHGLISKAGLESLGERIIQLCDDIETYGLVDYQYGVWEKQILEVLTECVDTASPVGPRSPRSF